jgi:NAD(P)-dependent dehydrogenase (short-subunit alcohol dehydrogenase family)
MDEIAASTARHRRVLITGASSGIGKAAARLFADRGFRVFGTSRYARADARGIEMLRLDVRSNTSVTQCVDEVIHRAAGLDVLVNNAGVEHLGIAEETSLFDAQAVFDTNFFGVVRVIDAVLPYMRSARRGRIINIGSLAAWVGEPGEAFYAASKRALAGYTEALRHEVWPVGLHVSLVEPSVVRTNILAADWVPRTFIGDYDAVRDAAFGALWQNLTRGGDPSAVAELIVRVALARSPKLRYGLGTEARWIRLSRSLLPQRWFDALVRRGFGLKQRAF